MLREESHQILFDHRHIGVRGHEAEPVAEPLDVGIDHHSFVFLESIAQYDVCRLAGHPPKGEQFFHGARHLAAKLFDKCGHSRMNGF